MKALRVSSVDALIQKLEVNPSAREDLLAQLTIGETYFFREHEQLDYLRHAVLPPLLLRSATDPVRVWSAGCSTGEEAYSLAITMREVGLRGARVIGTDISRERLEAACKARYTKWSLRGMSEARVAEYFDREGRNFVLRPHWREGVEFRYLNLADDIYPTFTATVWGMDVILCRNVLIYFDDELVRRVARRLLEALRDDGWLFVGASDPVLSDLVECKPVLTPGGLAYRRIDFPRQVAVTSNLTVTPELPPQVRAQVQTPEPAEARTHASPPNRAGPERELPSEEPRRSVQEWSQRIRQRANHGATAEAVSLIAQALREHPLAAELLYLQGVLHLESGDPQGALSLARRALYVDRSFISAHLLLANVQTRLEQKEPAIRALRNARALLSELPEDAVVPATDEVPARLISMIDLQLQLLKDAA
jgi:chemotaxis protein methyltransferase CheR